MYSFPQDSGYNELFDENLDLICLVSRHIISEYYAHLYSTIQNAALWSPQQENIKLLFSKTCVLLKGTKP